jgi:hypothetical protein
MLDLLIRGGTLVASDGQTRALTVHSRRLLGGGQFIPRTIDDNLLAALLGQGGLT